MTDIDEIIWDHRVREKLERKHHVTGTEVESALIDGKPVVKRFQGVYQSYAQTANGRYLFTVFIYMGNRRVRIVTARDMTDHERRWYKKRR